MIEFQKDNRHFILTDNLEIIEVFEADNYPEAEVVETAIPQLETDDIEVINANT